MLIRKSLPRAAFQPRLLRAGDSIPSAATCLAPACAERTGIAMREGSANERPAPPTGQARISKYLLQIESKANLGFEEFLLCLRFRGSILDAADLIHEFTNIAELVIDAGKTDIGYLIDLS